MITGSSGSATSDPGPPMTDLQHRREYPAAPDRMEHRRLCRTRRNGRPPRMPPQAERKNTAHAVPSRTEEHRVCHAGKNRGPPRTLDHARQNGTPMSRRAEWNISAHTGPRQTERNTATHTGPRQTERNTTGYAAPRGTGDCRACRPGWNGRTPGMPR